MQAILDFLDRYAIDPHVYIVAATLDGQGRYELFWDRDEQIHWRLRVAGTPLWERCSTASLLVRLRLANLDLASIEQQVRSVVLMQVVFADTLMMEAREVFGEHSIRKALHEHEAFLTDLRRVVFDLTRGSLRPVLGGGEVSPARAGHLSVVPSAP